MGCPTPPDIEGQERISKFYLSKGVGLAGFCNVDRFFCFISFTTPKATTATIIILAPELIS